MDTNYKDGMKHGVGGKVGRGGGVRGRGKRRGSGVGDMRIVEEGEILREGKE